MRTLFGFTSLVVCALGLFAFGFPFLLLFPALFTLIIGSFTFFFAAFRAVSTLLLVVRVAGVAPVVGSVTAIVIVATGRCRLAFLRFLPGITGENRDDFS